MGTRQGVLGATRKHNDQDINTSLFNAKEGLIESVRRFGEEEETKRRRERHAGREGGKLQIVMLCRSKRRRRCKKLKRRISSSYSQE